MGPLVNDKVEFTNDGTAIRPFNEAEQETDARRSPFAKGVVVLALAGIAALVKTFFGGERAAATDTGVAAASANETHALPTQVIDSQDVELEEHPVIEPLGEDLEQQEQQEQQILRMLRQPLDHFPVNAAIGISQLDGALQRASSTMPQPQNDNETLYGFVPGFGIPLNQLSSGTPQAGGGTEAGGLVGPTDEDRSPSGSGSSSTGPDSDPGSNTDPTEGVNEGGEPTDSEAGSVEPGNRRPTVTGPVRLPDGTTNYAALIGLTALLANSYDADGDELHVVGLTASSGQLKAFGENQWLFTPERNDTGEVGFTYEISDGALATIQFANLDLTALHAKSIHGTDQNDVILGTAHVDVIDALDGDDIIVAREGDDVVFAGEGNDRIVGGDGDDTIFAGAGDDLIFGGNGNDTIFAGSGDDRMQGDAGNDTMLGEDGDDTFIATLGDGDDVIDGGSGSDTYTAHGTAAPLVVSLAEQRSTSSDTGTDRLTNVENIIGGSRNDQIEGDAKANNLNGSAGNDIITGLAGNDILAGETGDDTFVATKNDGDDDINGGSGNDTYDASQLTSGIYIDLANGTATGVEVGTDTITAIEHAIGGSGNDVLVANQDLNILTGGAGNDIFVFSPAYTKSGSDWRDRITDFEVGDRINIKNFSEDAADALNDVGFTKFVLISQNAEFDEPGQIRFRYEHFDDYVRTIIEGNIDNDFASHEFEIELYGMHNLIDRDFADAFQSNPN